LFIGRLEHRLPFELTDFRSLHSVAGWFIGNLLNVIVFIGKGLVPRLRHDVDSLDVAAASHRSSHDGVLEIHRADGLR
jgi:hypothetical protein